MDGVPRYLCPVTESSATQVWCTFPDVQPPDFGRNLSIAVRCPNGTATWSGVTSYGRFRLHELTGCEERDSQGRLVGCRAGQVVTLRGDGFGVPGDPSVTSGDYWAGLRMSYGSQRCGQLTVLSNSLATCQLTLLSSTDAFNTFLTATVTVSALRVDTVAQLSYAWQPQISSISGSATSPPRRCCASPPAVPPLTSPSSRAVLCTSRCKYDYYILSGGGMACRPGDVLTIGGPAQAFLTPLRVTLNGLYECLNPTFAYSASFLLCTLPSIDPSTTPMGLLNLTVRVVSRNVTGPPADASASSAVASLMMATVPLVVLGVSGCKADIRNGSLPWKADGCQTGDVLTLSILGFNTVGSRSILFNHPSSPTLRLGDCAEDDSPTYRQSGVPSNTSVRCTLRRGSLAANGWLDITAYAMGSTVVGGGLIRFAPTAPTILSITGCYDVLTKRTSPALCRPGAVLTLSSNPFLPSELQVELRGTSTYTVPATSVSANSFSNLLNVRLPFNVSSADLSRNVTVFVLTVGGQRSAPSPQTVTIISTTAISSISGCALNSGSTTALCRGGELVLVGGVDLSTDTRLLVGSEQSYWCSRWSSSSALCTLPSLQRNDTNALDVYVESDGVLSDPLPQAVAFIPTVRPQRTTRRPSLRLHSISPLLPLRCCCVCRSTCSPTCIQWRAVLCGVATTPFSARQTCL